MLHSLWSLSQVNPGFRTDRTVTAEVSMDATACQTKGRCQDFFETLANRLGAAAGAESVALTDALPLSGREGNYIYDAEGHPRDARQEALIGTGRIVTPGYFATLGLQRERGRLLDEQDASGTSRAVVINQTMAVRLWPHEDPLGRHINNVDDEAVPGVWKMSEGAVVVGVVSNAHEGSLASGFEDEVYLPMTPSNEKPVMYVLLRTRASPQEVASELRRAVAELNPAVPVTRLRSLNEVVSATESMPRSLTVLLLAFGGLAVMIGGIGVYSLIAYIVSWRTREIGIRLALGAHRWQIIKSVMRQSLVLALGGSVLGLVAAALAAQLLRNFLFGVRAVDPITFCAVPLLMTALALMAAWLPARRAASVDPMKTLRSE
jgi:predicted permease